MYLNQDKTVFSIKYYGNYLYKDNAVCSNLYDYCFTSEERSSYIFSAQETVKNVLKSPSSAKFPWDFNEWKLDKNNGIVEISCYVDADNAYGANLRSYFTIKVKNKEVISFIFDGKEYVNQ